MKVNEVDWHNRGNRRFDLPGEIELDERRAPASNGNERAVIGGNNPPQETVIEFAATAMNMMTVFLNDTPVIETEEQAKAITVHIDTARGCIAGMETERDGKVRPLNTKVAEINLTYKAVSTPFDRVLKQAKLRLGVYLDAIEAEKERIAAEVRRIADAKIAEAREAERLEQEAIANAAVGELDAGVAERIVEADEKFADAKLASRQAQRAERETTVRVGGGQGRRAMGLRDQTTLTLDDPIKALVDMGTVSERTRESILSDARAYQRLNGKLPAGVTAVVSRGL